MKWDTFRKIARKHTYGTTTKTGVELLSIERTSEGKHLTFRKSEHAEEQLVVDKTQLAVGRLWEGGM